MVVINLTPEMKAARMAARVAAVEAAAAAREGQPTNNSSNDEGNGMDSKATNDGDTNQQEMDKNGVLENSVHFDKNEVIQLQVKKEAAVEEAAVNSSSNDKGNGMDSKATNDGDTNQQEMDKNGVSENSVYFDKIEVMQLQVEKEAAVEEPPANSSSNDEGNGMDSEATNDGDTNQQEMVKNGVSENSVYFDKIEVIQLQVEKEETREGQLANDSSNDEGNGVDSKATNDGDTNLQEMGKNGVLENSVYFDKIEVIQLQVEKEAAVEELWEGQLANSSSNDEGNGMDSKATNDGDTNQQEMDNDGVSENSVYFDKIEVIQLQVEKVAAVEEPWEGQPANDSSNDEGNGMDSEATNDGDTNQQEMDKNGVSENSVYFDKIEVIQLQVEKEAAVEEPPANRSSNDEGNGMDSEAANDGDTNQQEMNKNGVSENSVYFDKIEVIQLQVEKVAAVEKPREGQPANDSSNDEGNGMDSEATNDGDTNQQEMDKNGVSENSVYFDKIEVIQLQVEKEAAVEEPPANSSSNDEGNGMDSEATNDGDTNQQEMDTNGVSENNVYFDKIEVIQLQVEKEAAVEEPQEGQSANDSSNDEGNGMDLKATNDGDTNQQEMDKNGVSENSVYFDKIEDENAIAARGGANENVESDYEVIELEFESAVEKVHTHIPYCPKCRSQITKVILRRKKPPPPPLDLFGCSRCFIIFTRWGKRLNPFQICGAEEHGSGAGDPTGTVGSTNVEQEEDPSLPRGDVAITIGRGVGTGQQQVISDESLGILKCIVHGGLMESIASLSIVSSAAASDATTLNIIALGVASVISGLLVFGRNLVDLKNENANQETDRYRELLGRRGHFLLHATFAILSFLVFGIIPPIVYGFAFRESDNKDYKILAVAVASFISVFMLAIGKAYVTRLKKPTGYFTTILYYITMAISISGVAYAAGDLIKMLIDRLGWFEPNQTGPSFVSDAISGMSASY